MTIAYQNQKESDSRVKSQRDNLFFQIQEKRKVTDMSSRHLDLSGSKVIYTRIKLSLKL